MVERLNIPNLKLYNRKNAGQCASSNFGLSKSSGELIKFLDADDIIAHDCIEKMVFKVERKSKPPSFWEVALLCE